MDQAIMVSSQPVYRMLMGTVAFTGFAMATVQANERPVELRLSIGSSWQLSNDVQIPNNEASTRFSLHEAAGEGPVTFTRLEAKWSLNHKHGIRVLLAPLEYTESVVFDTPVRFVGQSYNSGEPVDATYRFNSWRIGYYYTYRNSEKAR